MADLTDPRTVIQEALPAVAWAYVEDVVEALANAGWALAPADGSGGQFRWEDSRPPLEPLPTVAEPEAEPEGGRADVSNPLTALSEQDLSLTNLDL